MNWVNAFRPGTPKKPTKKIEVKQEGRMHNSHQLLDHIFKNITECTSSMHVIISITVSQPENTGNF